MNDQITVSHPLLTEEQKLQFVRDGYVKVSGILSPELVETTKANLFDRLGINPDNPETWQGKPTVPADEEAIRLTVPCRNDAFEAVVEQLVGPHFVRSITYSPFTTEHFGYPTTHGFIPVLNYPKPGPKEYVRPEQGYHIDGGDQYVTRLPDKNFLAVMAYLTDVTEYGGATVVCPGSHRQVFEAWTKSGEKPSTRPPSGIDYAPAIPVIVKAGDVVFMHYLLVHASSANHADIIRVGMNTAVWPAPAKPYIPKKGSPTADWSPMDWTLAL